MSKKDYRIYDLDFFRGIAILLVIFCHISYLFSFPFGQIFGIGRYGVVLFYLISGLTIRYNFYAKYVKQDETIFVKDIFIFYSKRFFRIGPLFYLLLLLFRDTFHTLWPFFFLGNIDVYSFNKILHVEWSIYVEMLFYFMAPLTIKIFRKKVFIVLFLMLFVSIAYRIYITFYIGWIDSLKPFLFFQPVNFLYVFYLGWLLYDHVIKKSFLIDKKLLYFCMVLLVVLVFPLKFWLGKYFFLIGDYLFVCIFIMAIYLKFIYYPKIRLIILEKIGLISYSLYLLHYILLNFLKEYFVSNGKLLAIYLIILFPLCYFSYISIEKPGIKLGSFLIKRLN